MNWTYRCKGNVRRVVKFQNPSKTFKTCKNKELRDKRQNGRCRANECRPHIGFIPLNVFRYMWIDLISWFWLNANYTVTLILQHNATSKQILSSHSNMYKINFFHFFTFVSPKNKQMAHNQVYNRQIGLRPSQHMLVLSSLQSVWHCLFWRLVSQCREVMTP